MAETRRRWYQRTPESGVAVTKNPDEIAMEIKHGAREVVPVPLAEHEALVALKARVENAPLTQEESDKALEPIRGHVLMHLLAYRKRLLAPEPPSGEGK